MEPKKKKKKKKGNVFFETLVYNRNQWQIEFQKRKHLIVQFSFRKVNINVFLFTENV